MTTVANPIERARARVGHALFLKVAGPDGPAARARIHDTPGPRWFPPGAPIRRVHGDASNFVGGLRALLMQSLHPLAMAGVAGHSGYRGDPWGRLARTSTFLAYTTFGTAEHAQEAVDRVRAVHERVRGRTADGREYRASDPHLLTWIHIAEVDSFLAAYQRYGERRLTTDEADEYVAQIGTVARRLGAIEVPTTTAELSDAIRAYRPELGATAAAIDTARFVLHEPPLPWAARGPYAMLAAGAVRLLPAWARDDLHLGWWSTRPSGGIEGAIATRAVRWGLSSSQNRRARTQAG
jgi:uncharacterized protein (DUF2236 family)